MVNTTPEATLNAVADDGDGTATLPTAIEDLDLSQAALLAGLLTEAR
ncbi:MAG: hypothetical protein ACRDNO_11170 [Trebonia sp.]